MRALRSVMMVELLICDKNLFEDRRVASSSVVASRIKAISQASARAAVREEARTGNRSGGAGWFLSFPLH